MGRWPSGRSGQDRAAPYGCAGSQADSTRVSGSRGGSAMARNRSTAPRAVPARPSARVIHILGGVVQFGWAGG